MSDSHDSLVAYGSYDLAWLGPIVYPLALAIVSILYTGRDLIKTGNFREPQNLVTAAVVGVEAFFALCCMVQCALNFSKRRYVGLDSACDFQGWYATWWVYSSILMAPLLGWISLALVSKPHELPMPSTKRIGATIVGILTLAMLLALLPFMGVGQFNFVKDYCMFDMADRSSGGFYVAIFFSCTIFTLMFHYKAGAALARASAVAAETTPDLKNRGAGNTAEDLKLSKDDEEDGPTASTLAAMPTCFGCLTPRLLQYVMVGWYFIIWLPTATIVLMYLAKSIVPPASSAISAVIAITLHSQQLFQPLVVGFLWRRWAAHQLRKNKRSAESLGTLTLRGTKTGNETKTGPSPSKLQQAVSSSSGTAGVDSSAVRVALV